MPAKIPPLDYFFIDALREFLGIQPLTSWAAERGNLTRREPSVASKHIAARDES